MDLTGKLSLIMPSVSGISKQGNQWEKQTFVIDTIEEYPKQIAFEAWGDDCRPLNDLKLGNIIKVFYNVESKPYGDKWFTTLKSWKIQPVGK